MASFLIYEANIRGVGKTDNVVYKYNISRRDGIFKL
jgi:hypothetical protein